MNSILALARQKAKKYGVPPALFVRQIRQESGGRDVTSPAGAQGPAQIMPATARAWGVKNVHDPNQALDAAAKHMALYAHQFGSWKDALIAYNAGPGAVGKRLPAETQNYIKVILGGKGGGSVPTGGTPGTPDTTTTLRDTAALEQAQKRAVLAQYLQKVNPDNALLKTGAISPAPVDPAQFDQQATIPGTPGTPGSGGHGGKFDLLELFWQGQNGINIKHGQRVPQGFVEGHTDHVHVASGPKQIVQIGRLAESMGLHVGENPHFGGVAPVHAPHSYHYRNQAIDVSGDPQTMAEFAHRLAKMRKH